jgi:hypothetical protein
VSNTLNVNALPAGANTIGTVNTSFNGSANGNTLNVVTTASTNATSVKAGSGQLIEVTLSNPTATAASVKFYNKGSAPTVGTDIPVLTKTLVAGETWVYTPAILGKKFASGIALAVTALPAATDTGVAVAGVQINGTYV